MITLITIEVFTIFLDLYSWTLPTKYRPALFVFFLFLAIFKLAHTQDLGSPAQESCHDLINVLHKFHLFNAFFIQKYTIPSQADGKGRNWRGAQKMWFNFRWIGTDRELRGIPCRQASERDRLPKVKQDVENLDVKSRMVLRISSHLRLGRKWHPFLLFTLERAKHLAILHAASFGLDFVIFGPHPYALAPMDFMDVLPVSQVYFRRLFLLSGLPFPSKRETLIRVWYAVKFPLHSVIGLTYWHTSLGLLAVGFSLDEPSEWPPMYGNIKDAYSIGRYWGTCWHKLPYGGYVNIAKIISEKWLKLSRKGMVGKLVVNFLVFAMSGMVHALLQKKLGYSCGNWPEFLWWIGNFCVVVLEVAVQKVVADLRIALRWKRYEVFDRTLGYVWVFLFMFWGLPKAQFPRYLCDAALQ